MQDSKGCYVWKCQKEPRNLKGLGIGVNFLGPDWSQNTHQTGATLLHLPNVNSTK